MNYRRGFSLVELLTVLAVLGVLVFIGIPSFSGLFSSIELQGETRRVASDLREYHHIAVIEYYNCEFTFDRANDKYTIEKVDPGNPLIRQTVKTVSTDVDITDATTASVIFQPTGNTAATATIVLKNEEGEQSTLNVYSSTGHVRVQ